MNDFICQHSQSSQNKLRVVLVYCENLTQLTDYTFFFMFVQSILVLGVENT